MAKQFNLTARINAKLNTSSLRKELDALKNRINGVKGTINLTVNPQSVSSVRALNAELVKLNMTMKSITGLAQSTSKSFSSVNTATASVAKSATQMNKATKSTQKSMRQTGTAVKKTTDEIAEFGRVSGLAIRRFAGFTIATTIVFGFLRSVSSAISEAIRFQRELVRVAQVTKTSTGALGGLTKEITRLATTYGVASERLIKVSRILSQTGLSADQTRKALQALAKSDLAPTFTDIEKTAEGAIAAMRQFKFGTEDLESALGSINAVAGKFAVESDDIIAAIRRAGGVFSAASTNVKDARLRLNQFIATFTAVRATTRESAESIATGLRTIFTRIQRESTIVELRKMGIELTDVEGKFVGAYEAVNILGRALANLDPRDIRFARIAEQLGGFRQISKVIPLIRETETRMKALRVAQEGHQSLTDDSTKAQEAFAVQLTKIREEFVALTREFTNTTTFKVFISGILELTSALIKLAREAREVLPLISALLLVRGVKGGMRFLGRRGFAAGVRGREAPGFSGGGLVPGGKGTKDDFPANLQRGEYVLRRRAVDALGVKYLDTLNKYAQGGSIRSVGGSGDNRIGGALLRNKGGANGIDREALQITPGMVPSIGLKKPLNYTIVRQGLSEDTGKGVRAKIGSGLARGIDNGARLLGGTSLASTIQKKNLLRSAGGNALYGKVFEGMLLQAGRQGQFDAALDSKRPFDFPVGTFRTSNPLSKHYPALDGLSYVEAKINRKAAQRAEFKKKVIAQLELEEGARVQKQAERAGRKKTAAGAQKEAEAAERRRAKSLARLRKGRNRGGPAPANAMLTRGEYVMGKDTVKKLGTPFMQKLNNATSGLPGFARGGYSYSAYMNSKGQGGMGVRRGIMNRLFPYSHPLPPPGMPPTMTVGTTTASGLTPMPGISTIGTAGSPVAAGFVTRGSTVSTAYMPPSTLAPFNPPVPHGPAAPTTQQVSQRIASPPSVRSLTALPNAQAQLKEFARPSQTRSLQSGGASLAERKALNVAQRTLAKVYQQQAASMGKQQAATYALTRAKDAYSKTLADSSTSLGSLSKTYRLANAKFQTMISKVGQTGFGRVAGGVARGIGGVKRGVGRVTGAVGGGLSRLGGTALLAPLVASQIDPEGTNTATQAISGGVMAGGLAASLGLGPVGAIAAGAYGAMSGVQQAQAAQANADANSKLEAATTSLEMAMKNLATGGISEVDQAFGEFAMATRAAEKAIREERQGALGAFSDDLGDVTGKTNWTTRLKAFVGVKGASAELAEEERKANIEDFRKLQQRSVAGSETAKKLIARGGTLSDAQLEQIGLQQLDAQMTGSGKSFTLSDEADANKAKVAGEAFVAAERERIRKLNEENQAITNNVRVMEDLITQFKRMSAVAKESERIMGTFAETARLAGARRGGRVAVKNVFAAEANPFANPEAFDARQLQYSAGVLANRLPGSAQTIGKASRMAVGGKLVEDNIENVIARVAAAQQSQGLRGEEATMAVTDAINTAFANVPAEIRNVLINDVSKKIQSRQGSTLQELSSTGYFGDIKVPAVEAAMKSLADVQNTYIKNMSEFNQNLSNEIQVQLDLMKRRTETEATNAENMNKITEMSGRTLTLQQRVAPLAARVKGLSAAGGIAGGTTNAGAISMQLNTLIATQRSLEQSLMEARDRGDNDAAVQLQKQLAVTSYRIEANTSALDILAKDTTRLAAIQAEIAAVEKRREDANKSLLDLMQGGFKEQAQFQQRLNVLGQFLKDPNKLSPQMQAQAVKTAQDLGPMAEFLFPGADVKGNLGTLTAQATGPFFARMLGITGPAYVPTQGPSSAERARRARDPNDTSQYGRAALMARGADPLEVARRWDLAAQGVGSAPGTAGGRIHRDLGSYATTGLTQAATGLMRSQQLLANALTQMQALPGVLRSLETTLSAAMARIGAPVPAQAPGMPPAFGGGNGGRGERGAAGAAGAVGVDQVEVNATHQVAVNILGAEGLQDGIKQMVIKAVNKALAGINTIDGSIEPTPFRTTG